jgi:hypothetical protein
MDPTEGSETSANINQTLGIHPKVETVNIEHSESLKSRIVLSQLFNRILLVFSFPQQPTMPQHSHFLSTLAQKLVHVKRENLERPKDVMGKEIHRNNLEMFLRPLKILADTVSYCDRILL